MCLAKLINDLKLATLRSYDSLQTYSPLGNLTILLLFMVI